MLSSRANIVVKKTVVENKLIKLLTKHLKELGIIWVPYNFRQALRNPKLPADLLEKLENLIAEAEASNWKISKAVASEIDDTVEDIETFNPAYRAAHKKEMLEVKRDIKLGRGISFDELKVKYGVK